MTLMELCVNATELCEPVKSQLIKVGAGRFVEEIESNEEVLQALASVERLTVFAPKDVAWSTSNRKLQQGAGS